jgi:hypothetical protein
MPAHAGSSGGALMDRSTPPSVDPQDRVWFDPPADSVPGSYGSVDQFDTIAGGPTSLPAGTFVFGPGGSPGGSRLVRTLLSVGLVVLLVAGGLVFWFSRSGGGGVALAIEMPAGQQLDYLMTMSMQGTVSAGGATQPVDVGMSGRVGWHVVSVDADGVATVELKLSKLTVNAAGHREKTKNVTVTIEVSRDGRITSGTDLGVLSGQNGGLPGGTQFMPILPDHPVKPGETWSQGYEQHMNLGYGSLNISATGTLVHFETDAGHKVAVVQTTERIPVHMTVDLDQVAKAFHIAGMPSGAKISYSGSVNVQEYSWVDTVTKALLKSTSESRFHLDMSFEGFGNDLPNGTNLTFDGSLAMTLSQPGSTVSA